MAGPQTSKTLDDEPAHAVDLKSRRCLSCEEIFASQWAGERICKRCKHSSAWHAGVAYRSVKSR